MVAKGIIKSRHNKYVIEGDMFGDAFWAITDLDVSPLGCGWLLQPFGDIQNVGYAIVIALLGRQLM